MNNLKTIPLPEYCLQNLGYKVVKAKDSRLWRCLKAPNGTNIIAKAQPNDQGHYLYKAADNSHSGSLIDLLQHVHGYGWDDLKSLKPPQIAPTPPSPNCPIISSPLPSLNFEDSPPKNYLTKRGISMDTLHTFGQGASAYSTFFPLWEIDSQGHFFKKTAIKYYLAYGERRRRFLGPRAGAISILRPLGHKGLRNPSKLCMFESPIDALSFWQINKFWLKNEENVFLISTCGTPTDTFKANFKFYLDRLGAYAVLFGFDNDAAGKRNTELFERLLPEKIKRDEMIGQLGGWKDWNEKLQN